MAALVLTPHTIECAIHVVRGHRVLLDADLAKLYGVGTKRLNEAVKRHRKRFPGDFMLRLTVQEALSLRSQIATSKGRGGRRNPPFAFTQEGVAMLSSVLGSTRAIAINIEIMRVFVRLRNAIMVNADFAKRLAIVEASLSEHRASLNEHKVLTGRRLSEHERHIRMALEAIRQLMDHQDEQEPPSPIGFQVQDDQ